MSQLNIVITGLLDDAMCEFSGKTGEALQVHLGPDQPASVIGLNSLIPMIRFTAAQQRKTAGGGDAGASTQDRKAGRSASREAAEG